MSPSLLMAAALTLADLESRLLPKHPEYLQAEAAVRMAEGREQQAGLYPNPTIGATGEHVSRSTRGGSIGGFVEQRIVMGGKLGIDRALAGREIDQAKAMREAWRLRLHGQLAGRFYAAVTAAERVKAGDELAAVAADSAKIARELRNLGLLDEPDIRAADVEAQRAALAAAEARQMERRARAELGALFPEEPQGELAGEVDELPAMEREALWARILAMSPEVAMAVTEKAKADLVLRQARAARIPDLQLRGGLRNNREYGDVPGGRPVGVEGIFDVGVEIPLFNRQQGNLRAARAGVEKMELERARTERQLRTRFAAAWQRYDTARLRASRYRNEMIPSARQAFQMYQRNFRGMQGPYTRVLEAQRSYFTLRHEYFDILGEGWRAAAELESLLLAGEER